jgi:hypothetical protein
MMRTPLAANSSSNGREELAVMVADEEPEGAGVFAQVHQ